MHISTSYLSFLAASLAFILKILLFSVTFWPWLSHTSPSYDLSKKQFEGQVFTKPIKTVQTSIWTFQKKLSKTFRSDVINRMISWLYILMAVFVHTCTEYVQYRICLTSMKDNGGNYRTFCSGKKCRTVRRRSANVRHSIVSISGRSRSERPVPQSATIRVRLSHRGKIRSLDLT